MQGREPRGKVRPGADYEAVRKDLAAELAEMTDPATGERMVERVFLREELYDGPMVTSAPDLVVAALNGFDYKGAVNRPEVTFKGVLNGMHTTYDAHVYASGVELRQDNVRIEDVMPSILKTMGIPVPADVDGRLLY